MKKFDNKHFQKFSFTDEQSDRFFQSALRDLKIYQNDSIAEVKFTYAYQALLKAGIALLAKNKSLKVRSIPGHHVAVISKVSEVLNDDNINIIGHRMRMKRNKDLYDGGDIISAKEANECLEFVEKVIKRIGRLFKAGEVSK